MDKFINKYLPYLGTISDNHYIQAAIVVVVFLLLAKIVDLIIYKLLAKLVSKTKTRRLDNQLVKIIHRPLFYSVLLAGISIVLMLLELQKDTAWTMWATVKSFIIIIWSYALLRIARLILRRISYSYDSNRLVRAQTLPLFENLVLLLVIAIAGYMVLSIWKVDMTAWFASAGIAGIAIGFAARDTLANLFSGVFIMADSPYKIGDFVVLDSGERGRITHIGIRSTRLLTLDDIEITIPNSIMGNSKIINESGGPYPKHRIRVKVNVAYGSDIDQVRAILMEVASNEESVSKQPEPRVRFRTFGESGLDIELLCWIDQPANRGRVLDILNTAVYKRFAEDGIEIPYPKRDVYIKESP